ncbi:hypothetical protein VIMY103929_08435 [Vibrio mytili]|uniref:Uncharacterized protein n=1 Tax=Vibrio mytili TaxID=50718 RepID=A0A0C3ICQ6_9VIBR|nr:hypothetical protein SU60_03875 [Vibrio mytili]
MLQQKGAEIIHETGCFAIVQDPLAQLDTRVCPTACWTFDEAGNFLFVQQAAAQINLMMVSCVLNTEWGKYGLVHLSEQTDGYK